jgi:hypothetical protein
MRFRAGWDGSMAVFRVTVTKTTQTTIIKARKSRLKRITLENAALQG